MHDPREGDRVLVASVEQEGVVTVAFGNGAYYVRLNDGDVIACGREVLYVAKSDRP